MKVLKKILISVFAIILILALVLAGIYFFVLKKYDIDLFKTAAQLKIISQDVDQNKLCPNAFGEDDFNALQSNVNGKFSGLIAKEDGKGYNGYYVDFSALEGKTPENSGENPSSLVFDDKQLGALAQTVFYKNNGGIIKLGEREISATLMQIDLSEFTENGGADFNIVAKLDLSQIKAGMNSFPYNLFAKYVPDSLYVSSTVSVAKTDDAFAYTVSHKALTLNMLSADDTADLFHTLDTVLKIGSAEDMNVKIGTVVTDALIGCEGNAGFAYSLKAAGAKRFVFASLNDGAKDAMIIEW